MLKSDILKKLREAKGFVSGQELCDEYGVSRTAVWKAMSKLKEDGFIIESVPNKGYFLKENADVLTKDELRSRLNTKWLGHSIFAYDEIDSTNTELQRLFQKDASLENGTLAVTENQVQGRGRRGRAWVAPAGVNIAMSFMLKPSFSPDRASMLTILMAIAVLEGIEEVTGVSCQIKWPNDVLINKKKVCGILTEMNSEPDFIHYVIIGTGINVNTESFSEEIKDIASSIYLETGNKVNRAELIDKILCSFERNLDLFESTLDLSKLLESYNSRLAGVDSEVRVLDPKGEYTGISRGINSEGELIVEKEDGTLSTVYAGEVSVRGIYGYI